MIDLKHEIEKRYKQIVLRLAPEEVASSGLQKAFDMACHALNDKSRENGDPFIYHPLNIATILSNEFGLNAKIITAVFLHETDRINRIDKRVLIKDFSEEIAQIVENLYKIAQIDMKNTGLQAEIFRKLIVSYSSDPRVILIKIADRLEVMRSLYFFPKSKQSKKAAETLLLYIPLAHKLGLYRLKSELEDLCLRYTDPAAYRDITTRLHISENSREMLVKSFIAPIKQELLQQQLKFELKYRTKSIFSIWNKMKVQNVPFEKVYDVFAIRIILDSELLLEKDDCWKTYSIITSRYEPDVKRLRDWITLPKDNGYESLHTTVKVDGGQYVEIQIRTKRMDHYAEHGMAAHWRYKGIKQEESGVEKWLENIRRQLETATSEKDVKEGYMPDEIFVFTPSGDLRQLPLGATVLDFAYDIHGNIGNKCISALRNGKNVPIRETLATGDVVEIITAKNQNPSPDWLSIVVTPKAKSQIKHKLRTDEAKVAELGKEILERKFKNWKVQLSPDPIPALAKYFKLKTITELYVKIALEELDLMLVNEVLKQIHRPEKQDKDDPIRMPLVKTSAKPKKNSDLIAMDKELTGIDYKFGKCCNPIFGDAVFGFVTVGKGITIHRTTCPNAQKLITQYGYRIVPVHWRKQESSEAFQVVIKVIANDEIGMMQKINDAVLLSQGVIRSTTLSSNKGLLEGNIHVYIQNLKFLDRLIHKLQHTKGILKVYRGH